MKILLLSWIFWILSKILPSIWKNVDLICVFVLNLKKSISENVTSLTIYSLPLHNSSPKFLMNQLKEEFYANLKNLSRSFPLQFLAHLLRTAAVHRRVTNKLDEDGRREGILIHILTSLEHVVKETTEKWHKVFWQISYRDFFEFL